ncbi:fimbria/pilus outer membrane usher protein [Achromobacter xylosoxidans]|uniref:fimbria/pilus outer membrane usher protein n=1 Tax=Alcaligenes xylosoxydans xylosoxydans TaxID=85698 RepID=UPI003BA7EEB6
MPIAHRARYRLGDQVVARFFHSLAFRCAFLPRPNVIALALAACAGAVHAQAADTAFSMPDGVLYLDVIVNGKSAGQVRKVDYRQGHYYLPAEVLKEVGVKVETPPHELVAVDRIPGVRVALDNAAQQLVISVPPDWLPRQVVDMMPREPSTAQADSSTGLLVNYDAYLNNGRRGSSLSVWNEQRLFSAYGTLSSTGTWRGTLRGQDSGGRPGFMRYDTQWRYNDAATMRKYVAGDFITDTLADSSSVRMAGFQVGRNFATRPDLVTFPIPQFAGQAAVPTAVDLFINNYRMGSREVGPGPFTLQSMPYINGAGTATVVTRDALGREVSQEVSFYVSNDLLQPGLSDYSASVGLLRRQYGLSSFDYGDLAASGVFRHGVTSGWTATGWAQGAAGFAAAGIGSNVQLGVYGVLSATVAASHAAAGKLGQSDLYAWRERWPYAALAGQSAMAAVAPTDHNPRAVTGGQWSLGYSYSNQRFSVGLRRTHRDDDFANLGRYRSAGRLARQEDQATASLSMGRYGSLGMGWFDVDYGPGQRTRLLNLSYGVALGQGVSLYTSANREIGSRGYNAQLALSISLGDGSSASASVSRDRNGRRSEQVGYMQAAPLAGGVGWSLGASHNPGASVYRQADVNWRTQRFDLRAGVYGASDDLSQWAQLGGSIILMDGALHLSRPVTDAFALISTDGYAGVPVSFENQYVGDTDSSGHLLIPSVSSWYPAHFEINPVNLPADVKIPVAKTEAAVRDRSGLLLRFPVEKLRAVVFSVLDAGGRPIVPGSQVRADGKDVGWVGRDGEVYLETLPASSLLHVMPANGEPACRITLGAMPPRAGIVRLGPVTCQ